MTRRLQLIAWCFASLAILAPSAIMADSLPMTFDLELANGAYVPLQSGRPLVSFDPQDRPQVDLAGNWKKLRLGISHDLSLQPRDSAWFTAVAVENGGATLADFDDSSWDDHTLPGVENVMPATPEDPAGAEVWSGGIYYRRHIDVPADWDGRVVRLVCLAADYIADLWVNGTWVGYHEGGYAPFAFDLSPYLVYGGDNVIVWRIDAMPWAIRMDILPNLFATDWQHYVGVIQDVYLEASPPAHLVRADVLPQNLAGDLDVSLVVENRGDADRKMTVRLAAYELDAEHPDYLSDPVAAHLLGEPAELRRETEAFAIVPAGQYRRVELAPRLVTPMPWTPAEPHLYALVVELVGGKEVLDTFVTQFGVRTVSVGEGAKVLLNRRPAFFTGVARHEDWPDSGRTATVAKIAADLQIVRDTNVRFLRTAHYPNHPATYLLTDRLGIAVWEEIPAWWINQISIPILLERGLAKQMWREMIWNQRNRPSILFWSLCNEPMWYFVFNLRTYVRDLHADLDDNFPDGRLVSQSLAADGAALTGASQQDVDVAGWTMYFGVFYGDDPTVESAAFLRQQHEKYPEIPLLVTEFGYWSNTDGGAEADQVVIARQTLAGLLPLAAVNKNGHTTAGYLAAATWWCQFNWYRVQDPHNQTMGLMHQDRVTAKPVYGTLKELYAPYFAMGGLGEEMPADDDTADDDTVDDDSSDDDDDNDDNNDNDDRAADDDDDNDDIGGCGC
ncbi:MAG: glycoside hydrolase family 2 [Myxococcales bacterium]|nr:glycoside hydrolase family 2 [Myxococcales bacterium]